MNYYEELGVGQDASPEEVRQACRTLARLLHPDTQTDEKLRAAADREMTRLNEILAVLTDQRQRRAYDMTLGSPMLCQRPGLPVIALRPERRRDWARAAASNWFFILSGMTALGTAIAWYATPLPETPIAPPAAQAPQPTLPVTQPRPPGSPLTGNWLTPPPTRGGAAPGRFPATYIECSLRQEQKEIMGNFQAKSYVSDGAVAAAVLFRIRGFRPSGSSGIAGWSADDGARGLLQFTLRSPNVIRLVWWTTSSGRQPAIRSGDALLIRQETP